MMREKSNPLLSALILTVISILACSAPRTVTPPSPTATLGLATLTPEPPTPSPEPATAAPPTTAPPTPTLEPEPTRIRFEPGATAATVTGSVEQNGVERYVLRASAGQTMETTVTSPRHDLLLDIWGADGAVLKRQAAGGDHWRGVLPSTQDYFINLVSTGAETNYELTVIVRARIQFEPGATSTTVEGGVEPNGARHYVLRASAGQIMEVSLVPPEAASRGDILLAIKGADGTVLKRESDSKAIWSGELPATQDYFVDVASAGEGMSYELLVTISSTNPTTGWKIYHNEEHGIEIEYPADFVVDAINCPTAAVGGEVVESFRLMGSEYYSGTNLSNACVIVGLKRGEEASSTCLEPRGVGEEQQGEEEINGITFRKFSSTEAAAGNIYETVSYRTTHGESCYEIALLMHSGNIGAYPEGAVTEFDREIVLERMSQVLSTFKFLE